MTRDAPQGMRRGQVSFWVVLRCLVVAPFGGAPPRKTRLSVRLGGDWLTLVHGVINVKSL